MVTTWWIGTKVDDMVLFMASEVVAGEEEEELVVVIGKKNYGSVTMLDYDVPTSSPKSLSW
jgi:hypothetical protein